MSLLQPQTYIFDVNMSCDGCSKGIERALEPLKGNGVENYEVSFDKKLVRVTCSSPMSAEEVLTAIQKTGKVATLINIEPLLTK
ncbi:copper transport protein ATOX1-like [Adelges cooleyi]|uniref:copper transport protein ATOX1-like n=1 Tax=Adelges cooleyi TaxID=133065 RepID=UPI00217F3A20|nr:copper transport protein ATOX1-like [Adelges cooleyi]